MVTKRFFILILILLWSMGTYYYLRDTYNPMAVELDINPSVGYERLEDISIKNRIPLYSMNYIMPYSDGKLIMTTGNDLFFRNRRLLYGEFITPEQDKKVVLGDGAVSKFFNTDNPVGSSLTIFEEDYTVMGVVSGSNDIYISYDKKLMDLRWQRGFFRYQPPLDYNFSVKVRDMAIALRTNEIYWSEEIVYQEIMNFYLNSMILSTILIIILAINKPFGVMKHRCKELWCQYQAEKRRTEWYQFIRKNNKRVMMISPYVILGVVILVILSKLVLTIVIPTHLIPDNLFSPASYWNIATSVYQKWLMRLNSGVEGILMDFTLSNIGLGLVLIITFTKWTFLTTSKKAVGKEI